MLKSDVPKEEQNKKNAPTQKPHNGAKDRSALSQALRENLKRRKAQSRAKREEQ